MLYHLFDIYQQVINYLLIPSKGIHQNEIHDLLHVITNDYTKKSKINFCSDRNIQRVAEAALFRCLLHGLHCLGSVSLN